LLFYIKITLTSSISVAYNHRVFNRKGMNVFSELVWEY
jgi:hypothetical protein